MLPDPVRALGSLDVVLREAPALAPYLGRLIARQPQTAEALSGGHWSGEIASAIALAKTAGAASEADAMAKLRHAKARLHLATAMADLAGAAPLETVTTALSDLADAAATSALAVAAAHAAPRDAALLAADGTVPGLFILAMGKHGAHELNYSSDVDLSGFFDRDAFQDAHRDQAGATCVRILGAVSRLLEDVTADGYVFRVDWRLRPDPASTKLAVSVQMAESYYESVGQNWERAALIKARAIAGDQAAAASFLASLQPFIWRKHLDFAAIADVQSILRQIHATRRSGGVDEPTFDVKLGRGGIREIEFFVQTQQLILGGRDPTLRVRGTGPGLEALVAAGRIAPNVRDDLMACYRFLRMVEHRIQMREDGHTHLLPADPEVRARIAALSGFDGLAAFDAAVRACRDTVRARVGELFPEAAPLSAATGSLVFTGVDDDPETLATLGEMGFADPAAVSRAVRGWHHGRIPATRTPRARELLTALMPDLLDALAATGEPDAAFTRFRDFFAGLSAGVQVLSLFRAEPAVLREVCTTLGLAPRLGALLSRRPAVIDAMLAPHFHEPLGPQDTPELTERLADAVAPAVRGEQGEEAGLDAVRIAHRDEAFRIGWHILHGRVGPQDAGRAWTDLAEAAIAALLPLARARVEATHGILPVAVTVCGWGKLGGKELAADSDLDLMVVYDAPDDVGESSGPRPLTADAWATRLTQRLVAGLSAPTAEGQLYDVDMQLRPSGRAGPVAVRIAALERYYAEGGAWLWEVQALTRLRPLAGDPVLAARIAALASRELEQARPAAQAFPEIAAMRARMAAAHPARGAWDVKRGAGGLIDLEFFTQAHLLAAGAGAGHQSTLEALDWLGRAGALPREQAERLVEAGRVLHAIRQLLAVASGPGFDPDTAPTGLAQALARQLTVPALAQALALHADMRAVVQSTWAQIASTAAATGSGATENRG